MKLNCIAVDDEPLPLELVCDYIEKTPFLHLSAKFSNGIEALRYLHEHAVDLIFLDIRMPDLSGIDMAKILSQGKERKFTKVIFTTAFDHYAIDGFKVDALDYLLKPFNYIDFSRTANKAFTYFELVTQKKPVEVEYFSTPPGEEFLYVKVEYQLIKIPLKDILYIEGFKDYVKIFLVGDVKPILSLITMKSLEERLMDKGFLRLHRSFIVSVSKIKIVTKNTVQINDIIITVTEQYRHVFLPFYASWFNQAT